MAEQKQVELVMDHLLALQPYKFYKAISEGNAGIGAVLRYLDEAQEDVTAGNISEFMHVSTARVAVLLRKMESQGLISKEGNAEDARITIVRLSDKGKERVRHIHDDIYTKVNNMIDKIGLKKMMDFITISAEIRTFLIASEIRT